MENYLQEELNFERRYLRKKKKELRKTSRSIRNLSSSITSQQKRGKSTPESTCALASKIHVKHKNKQFILSLINITMERIEELKKLKKKHNSVVSFRKKRNVKQQKVTQEAA
jgi:hypothetical protein